MNYILRLSRVSALVLPAFPFLLLLTCICVSPVFGLLRTIRLSLVTSQAPQDALAFLQPSCDRPTGCSSALGSFSSFFGRRKATPEASDQQQQQQQQQQQERQYDLYRLLGVPPDASASAISAQAKKLQGQLTELPGIRGAPVHVLLSSLVQEVAKVLEDPQQRAAFDREGVLPPSLSALLSQLPAAQPSPRASRDEEAEGEETEEIPMETKRQDETAGRPADLFSALFGGGLMGPSLFSASAGGPRARPQPQQGPDVEATVSLGFAAAALQGAPSLDLPVQRLETCGACRGTGGRGGSKPKACKTCEGRGLKTETRKTPFGFVSTSISCPACGGEGSQPTPRCGSCGGHGRQQRRATLQVSVPPGVSDGSLLVVEGQGSAGKDGGASGDLYLTVKVEGDSRFTRKGADVHSEESVSLADAALGGRKMVETLDGLVEVTIPPNAQPGQKLLLKGRGARLLGGAPGARGDHVVTLRVSLPSKISQEERQLLQRLRALQQGARGDGSPDDPTEASRGKAS